MTLSTSTDRVRLPSISARSHLNEAAYMDAVRAHLKGWLGGGPDGTIGDLAPQRPTPTRDLVSGKETNGRLPYPAFPSMVHPRRRPRFSLPDHRSRTKFPSVVLWLPGFLTLPALLSVYRAVSQGRSLGVKAPPA